LVLLLGTSVQAAESITVTSFGGAFSQSQIEAYQKTLHEENRYQGQR
jgi:hypothetical protein